jgi:hypothetical protein
MAGELGGRSRIIRRTLPIVPAGNISLNDAQVFKVFDRHTLGINIKNPAAGNTVRIYDKFPWEPRQKILDIDLQADPVSNLLLVANLGTDYRTMLTGTEFQMEHYELRELWMMAEVAPQLVEIVGAMRQS